MTFSVILLSISPILIIFGLAGLVIFLITLVVRLIKGESVVLPIVALLVCLIFVALGFGAPYITYNSATKGISSIFGG